MTIARVSLIGLALLGSAHAQREQSAVAADDAPKPIAFDRVDRTIGELPTLRAKRPLYGLFLFGEHADTRVWAVLDNSQEDADGYDVLHLDLDGDGDLTDDGERLVAEKPAADKATFRLAEWRDPGTGAVHTGIRLTWTPERTSYEIMWRDEAVTRGAYGPDSDSYGQFGDSPESAPILVPGWDRPLEFERWYSGQLIRGCENDFKVFVGNRGSAAGQFSCVDDEFLPIGEYPVATLIFTGKDGKLQRVHAKLTERC